MMINVLEIKLELPKDYKKGNKDIVIVASEGSDYSGIQRANVQVAARWR